MPPPRYECPNPDKKPKPLRQVIKEMSNHPEFAQFIYEQLCLEQNGTAEEKAAAETCLDSYFKATDAEIEALCLSDEQRLAVRACTEHHKLLSAAAYALNVS